jgi:Glu-tRNA(Gln) amidotransferase subunit E-like FAD-binding protein
MYPDTDSAPIPISREMIERIRAGLPTSPQQWRDRYDELLGREQVNQLIDRDVIEDFDLVYRETNAAPTLVARFVLEFRREVQRREGRLFPLGRTYFVQEELGAMVRIFIAFRDGEICRDLIRDLFTDVLEGGDLEKILEQRTVSSKEEIERAVAAVLGEISAGANRNREHERAETGFTERELSHLIGRVKKKIRGNGDGKTIRAMLEAQGVRHGA